MLLLLLVALLATSPALSNRTPNQVLQTVPVSDVQRTVFEGDGYANWLLVLHHGPCYERVVEAVDVIALAQWMQATAPVPPVRVAMVSCADPDQRTDLFFPGRCSEYANATHDHRRRPRQFPRLGRHPTVPPPARAWLVRRPDAESIFQAVEVKGFADNPGVALVEAARKTLGGTWKDVQYDRPASLLITNYISDYSSSATAVESRLQFRGGRRRGGFVTVTAGVPPDLDQPNAAGSLAFHMAADGGVVLDGDGVEGEGQCDFSPNWQVTVLRAAVCERGRPRRGKDGKAECDLRRAMFVVLAQIGAKREKFSVRGFMDKFARICQQVTEMYERHSQRESQSGKRKPQGNSVSTTVFKDNGGRIGVVSNAKPSKPLTSVTSTTDSRDAESSTPMPHPTPAEPTDSATHIPPSSTTTTSTVRPASTSKPTPEATSHPLQNDVYSDDNFEFSEEDFSSELSVLSDSEESIPDKNDFMPSFEPVETEFNFSETTRSSGTDRIHNHQVALQPTASPDDQSDVNANRDFPTSQPTTPIPTNVPLFPWSEAPSVDRLDDDEDGINDEHLNDGDVHFDDGDYSHEDDDSSYADDRSYADRYMDMMDALSTDPAMVRFRLGQIFRETERAQLASQAEAQRSSQAAHRAQRLRWRLRLERRCLQHHKRGRAFVRNYLRDVAYAADLLGAVRGSLDVRGVIREERRKRRRLLEGGRQQPRQRRRRLEAYEEERGIRRRQQLRVMTEYLDALHRLLLPLGEFDNESFRSYLSELRGYVKSLHPSFFSLRKFKSVESALRARHSPFNQPGEEWEDRGLDDWHWRGCRDGGFPCALWQLFHVLAVEQAHRWKWKQQADVKEFDLPRVLSDYVDTFYRSTSRSLFMRFYRVDPPGKGLDPEDQALWLWNAHNQVNLVMYDNALSRALGENSQSLPLASRRGGNDGHLCQGSLFPSRDVCPLCYKKLDGGTPSPRKDETDDDKDFDFRSRRVILRYLYAVYTRDKIV